MMKASRLVLVSVVMLGACSSEPRTRRSADENVVLGGGVVARVGDEPISTDLVARVAAAQQITPAEALRKVVDDAIVATAARERGFDRGVSTAWRLVSAHARFTTTRLDDEARALGPPTDEEIAALSSRHWLEVDRPPAVRVLHAIVLRPTEISRSGEARAAAAELQRRLQSVETDAFEQEASAVVHAPGLEVKVERLPAFTEDGRITEGGGGMDPTFSRAAFTLPQVGATSDVVETPFGYHVIRLLERLPEKRMPLENRRVAFAEEVRAMRARELMNTRLNALRKTTAVTLSPAAEPLMSTVRIETGARETAGAP